MLHCGPIVAEYDVASTMSEIALSTIVHLIVRLSNTDPLNTRSTNPSNSANIPIFWDSWVLD